LLAGFLSLLLWGGFLDYNYFFFFRQTAAFGFWAGSGIAFQKWLRSQAFVFPFGVFA
jgi:hypothetical protein